jgi:hypothetical protein
MEWLFSWEVTSWIVGILVAIGFSVLALDDFKVAKIFFLSAAADAIGGLIMWGVDTTVSPWARTLLVFALFGGIGVSLVQTLRYVDGKRAAKLPKPNLSTPPREGLQHPSPSIDLSRLEKGIAEIKANTTPIPDRHLNIDQVEFLKKNLSRFPKQPVRILYRIGDSESRIYASEFARVVGELRWKVQGMLPAEFIFKGLGIVAQDPTEVPEAAEAMAQALSAKGIKVQRFRDTSSVSIDGKHASPIFGLFISEKGDQSPEPKTFIPIHRPKINDNATPVGAMSDEELEQEAHQLANAMREFEMVNREHFEREWRVINHPIPKGSYRDIFEKDYRRKAIQLRDEMHMRLGLQEATVFALDADTLAGPQPITDAANYLDEIAKRLQAKQP